MISKKKAVQSPADQTGPDRGQQPISTPLGQLPTAVSFFQKHTAEILCASLMTLGLAGYYLAQPKPSPITAQTHHLPMVKAVGQEPIVLERIQPPELPPPTFGLVTGAEKVTEKLPPVPQKVELVDLEAFEQKQIPAETLSLEENPHDLAKTLEEFNQNALPVLSANVAAERARAKGTSTSVKVKGQIHWFGGSARDTNPHGVYEALPATRNPSSLLVARGPLSSSSSDSDQSCKPTRPAIFDPQCRINYPCPKCGSCCCMCEAVRKGLATAEEAAQLLPANIFVNRVANAQKGR